MNTQHEFTNIHAYIHQHVVLISLLKGALKKGIQTANSTSSDLIVQDNVLMHSLRREDGEIAAANQVLHTYIHTYIYTHT